VPSFDFSVAGVTSLSADTHKFGYAPKVSNDLRIISSLVATGRLDAIANIATALGSNQASAFTVGSEGGRYSGNE